MALDAKAEAEHHGNVTLICHAAMLDLRDTIKPNYDAKALGYNDADHARLVIVQQACKQIDKLAAEHLRKHPT